VDNRALTGRQSGKRSQRTGAEIFWKRWERQPAGARGNRCAGLVLQNEKKVEANGTVIAGGMFRARIDELHNTRGAGAARKKGQMVALRADDLKIDACCGPRRFIRSSRTRGELSRGAEPWSMGWFSTKRRDGRWKSKRILSADIRKKTCAGLGECAIEENLAGLRADSPDSPADTRARPGHRWVVMGPQALRSGNSAKTPITARLMRDGLRNQARNVGLGPLQARQRFQSAATERGGRHAAA